MKILVHLISEPGIANYIAARAVAADENIFLFTSEANDHKEWLRTLIGGAGGNDIQVSAYDPTPCADACRTILETRPGDEIILNFTGGTRIMAAGAYAVFPAAGRECVFIDMEKPSPEIIRFLPARNPEHSPANVAVHLPDYITLSGHTILDNPGRAVNGEMEAVRTFLRTEQGRVRAVIGQLMNQMKEFEFTGLAGPTSTMNITVGKASIHWNAGHLRLEARGKDEFQAALNGGGAAWYVTGGWMMDEVRSRVAQMREAGHGPLFHDVTMNLCAAWYNPIPWDEAGETQRAFAEIHVAAMHGARPLIIECKTGTGWKENLYRLADIRKHLGGSQALPLLVMGTGPIPEDLAEQARSMEINVTTLDELEHTLRRLTGNG